MGERSKQHRESARALIVTSNVAARRVLRSYLTKDSAFCFDIVDESHLRSATQRYRAQLPDLVLLGEELENGSPLEFLDSIHETPGDWHPVIFVHFSTEHEVCLEAMRRGAQETIDLGTLTSAELQLVSHRVHETLRLIRENHRVHLENARMVQELARSNEELGQFAYVISHDLKEPLRKITSYGDLLRQKLEPFHDEETNHYLNKMTDGATRMGSMMSALLEYARVTRRVKVLAWSSLEDAYGIAIEALEMRIHESQGKVVIETPLPTVQCEPLRLQQLFLNLIGNGLKYCREGVAPMVSIRAEPNGDSGARITITDNGIGFKPEQNETIFGIFQRLHARTSKYEGHGVGLAICKRIVESLGGTIEAQGQLGVGAQFIVHLPLVQWCGTEK